MVDGGNGHLAECANGRAVVLEKTVADAVVQVTDLRKDSRLGADVVVHALRGVSICVVPGEFVAIIGGPVKSMLIPTPAVARCC